MNNRLLRRAILHLKSIRKLAFVPIILTDIIFPTIIFMFSKETGGSEELYWYIVEYSYLFFPICSIWWPIFILREYLEADGNELLFVNTCRIKAIDIYAVFFIFMLNVVGQYIIFATLFPLMIFEFLRILCCCIMYLGISYTIAFFSKSVTLTLMMMLLYTVIIITEQDNYFNFVFFLSTEPISTKIVFEICIPQISLGFLCTGLGCILNAHFQKYR